MAKSKPSIKFTPMQLKVALLEAEPPIWRRIVVPDSMTLQDLHYVIQDAFGWTNSHLHQFIVNEQYYGDVDHGEDEDAEMNDEKKGKLKDIFPDVEYCIHYEYDMGDDWMHEIVRESIDAPVDPKNIPGCIDGARACPPDDCGGMGGYMHLIEVMSNPKHAEYKDMKAWLGGNLDPEAFDIKATNKGIKEDYTRKMTHFS